MNLLDLIFPGALYCVSCGRPLPPLLAGGFALCERCSDEIHWVGGRLCKKCGRPLSDENPYDSCHACANAEDPSFERGFACALYSGRAAEIVRDMKYREKAWYADTLASIMAARCLAEADPETGELFNYDYMVSVPMTEKKKASRGYDQASLLASGLSKRIGVPYLSKALARIRETGAMSGLSEDERRQNLASAFSVDCDNIQNKRILLADDVYTTGSSINACAKALLSAGAERVDFIVFAIGADSRRRRGEDRPAVVESPGQLRAKGPT